MTAAPLTWLLADDRPGNRTQVLGVGEALGWPFVVKDIRYSSAGKLPNPLKGATLLGLEPDSCAALAPPWPGLVIAAGRRTAPVARAIGRRAGGGAFLVQIMDPGSALGAFDLVVVPRHDRPPARANVLPVTGAPHRVTGAVLARARDEWAPRFAHLPAPRVALLVGGTTKTHRFTPQHGADLGERAVRLAAAAGGSLLVSTSRRTGAAADAVFAAAAAVPHHGFRWGDAGDNPFPGYLACADAVIVTGDSVSMVCEACAVPAPVYIYAPEDAVPVKHRRLHRELYERGCARPLEDTLAPWERTPLDTAGTIAAEIVSRLAVR